MSDHYDEMRVPPDPSLAEALRQRLHARMASASLDHRESRSHLQLDATGFEPDQHLVPVKENYVSVDSPPTSEVRNRRRLAMAAAAVVAVIGVAAIAINMRNSDDEAQSPVASPTVASTTAATPTTAAIATTTEPVGVPGALPDGTYRLEVTSSDLDAVNFHSYLFVGPWEWTFLGGHWSYQFASTSSVVQSTYEGTYNVDGDHITMVIPGQLWNEIYQPQEFTWVANPDGSLQFTALASTAGNWAAILASHPLVKASS